MPNNKPLKQKVLDLILELDCIVREPTIDRSGFILPTRPKAKTLVNDERFIQIFPEAVKVILNGIDDFDVVAGIELSGIAPAALAAYALKKPFAYIRKRANPYGSRSFFQGQIKNKKILLVDDLIFLGQTKNEAIEKVSHAEGKITGLFVIFTIDPFASAWSKQTNIPIYSLFEKQEIYQAAVAKKLITQEVYDLEQTIYSSKNPMYWHSDPNLWQWFVRLMTTDPTFAK